MTGSGMNPPRVLIAHNAIAAGAAAAELDVLAQVGAVELACRKLGYPCDVLPCSADLHSFIERVTKYQPDVVFNLVESLAGRDQLAWLIPATLETLGIPCTGTPAVPLNLSNDKLRTKERLQLAGLPTPAWYSLESEPQTPADKFVADEYILKAIGEHASLGLDDTAVVRVSSASELQAKLIDQSDKLLKPCFAEQFIPGREFNLSILATAGNMPEVLPPAEIDFSTFPPNKPHIVGHAAKWEDGSFEYHHTPRVFEFGEADVPLLEKLKSLARSCWQVLELAGWARVDFRVDSHGQPWILEVNTNCCLSPDAGFAAAVERSGLSLTTAVQRIIAAAIKPRAKPPSVARAADNTGVELRTVVVSEDEAQVREIVAATGMFRPNEVDVAAELVRTRLRNGEASGYEFVFAEQAGRVLGYACYGLNTLTVASYDLYWIAVRPELQGQGIGQQLLAAAEERIAVAGGQRIYIETSARPDYAPTRRFYERCGYFLEAVLRDYYAPGDDRAIFVRRL